jgi:hypothetical protein
MAEERSLDPRFDPRFQRGFDPATMPVEPETLRAPVEVAGPVPPTSPVLPANASRESVRLDVADEDDEDAELEPAPTRNPFRLALLLVSVGLLVLAAATLWWTANNQSAYLFGSAVEAPQNWMLQQLAGVVPPAAIVAGFVGIALWLGLGALTAKASATANANVNDRPEHPRGE